MLAASNDVAGGIALAQEAVEIAAATDLMIDHADACVALAALHQQAGDAAAARSVRDRGQAPLRPQGRHRPRRAAHRRGRGSGCADLDAGAAPTLPASSTTHPSPHDTEQRHDRAENVATRLVDQFVAASNDRRLDDVEALLAEDYHDIDRRTTVSFGERDRDGFMAANRAAHELGFKLTADPLAVRGERLCLGSGVWRTDAGDEIPLLGVVEADAEGRWLSSAWFDPDALTDALAELDARYFAGEGAALASRHRVGFGSFAAVNARDWNGFRDLYTPDLVCTDRRQIGWPTLDRDGLVTTMREYTELAPDLTLLPRKVELRGPVTLWAIDASGTTADGGAVEWGTYTVSPIDPTGVVSSMEMFDEDDFPAALARLDELGAAYPVDPRHPRAENTVTRAMTRLVELANLRDFERAGELIADGIIRDDRRRLVSAPTATGRDEYLDSVRAIFEAGYSDLTFAPVAVRGDRLALCRGAFRTGDGNESEFLQLEETDASGRFVRMVNFDEDAIADAVEELDASYIAGEGRPFAHTLQTMGAGFAATNRRDWEGLPALYAPDFALVDHRQLGWPTVDTTGLIAMMQGYVELAPDLFLLTRNYHGHGRAALVTIDGSGTTADGTVVEWVTHYVSLVDSDGPSLAELFTDDDFPAALARLDELGAETPGRPRHPRSRVTGPPNGSWRSPTSAGRPAPRTPRPAHRRLRATRPPPRRCRARRARTRRVGRRARCVVRRRDGTPLVGAARGARRAARARPHSAEQRRGRRRPVPRGLGDRQLQPVRARSPLRRGRAR